MGLLLRATNLSKAYRGRRVVRDVSFTVHPGEIVGLLGANGAGKTTAFSIVAGLLAADSGTVFLGDRSLKGLPLYQRARLGLGYLPQETTVFRGLSARNNLLAILEGHAQCSCRAQREARADVLLSQFNLNHAAHVLGAQLSGGERRRLEMARALIMEPQVLLLDEPFAGVDPIAVGEIRGFIRAVRNNGVGILLTDHNVRETLGICDRAYLIHEGSIMLAGSPDTIINNEVARRTYLGLDFAI